MNDFSRSIINKLLPLFVLALAGVAYTQTDLPDVGSLADIKGKTRIYIAADVANTKQILKALKNQETLVRVNKPDDADFFIEYRELRQDRVTSLKLSQISGQMEVYIFRDKRKIVVWSDSKVSGLAWPSLTLTKKFLKDFLAEH